VLALEIKFLCAVCTCRLRSDARWEGYEIRCPECQQTMEVPRWSRRTGPTVRLSTAEVEFLSGPIGNDAQPGRV
jgi:hypothetical protein